MLITATSEGQESLGPRADTGVFDSPLGAGKTLRGSFFTQSLFDFLEAAAGDITPAFERARLYRSQGERSQQGCAATGAAPVFHFPAYIQGHRDDAAAAGGRGAGIVCGEDAGRWRWRFVFEAEAGASVVALHGTLGP
jgi:hypothetical protein